MRVGFVFTPVQRIRTPGAMAAAARKKAAAEKGYSSAEEYAIHVLEQAAGGHDEALSEEQVKERLKGLGYVE